MNQYLYDILLLGFTHLFIIMILENFLLAFYVEKKFSGTITDNIKEIFYAINEIDEFDTDITADAHIRIDNTVEKIITKNNITNPTDLNMLLEGVNGVKNILNEKNTKFKDEISNTKFKEIRNKENFTKLLNNFETERNKNNKNIKIVVIIVNIIVLIIVVCLIFYGNSNKNNLQIRWKYLIISNIVSFIIIGILDGIFITSWKGEMYNKYEVTKEFINYIFN